MTERGRPSLQRDATTLGIGPSEMRWEGDALVIRIDEVTVPFPTRVRGEVRVHPQALSQASFALDPAGMHHWRPIAPCARVDVALSHPSLRWRGTAYVDSNFGGRPLETDVAGWHWSRGTRADGRTMVLYDVARRAGEPLGLALVFDAAGRAQAFDAPPRTALPRSGWRMARDTRTQDPSAARVLQTLEDAPFYARSLVETQLCSERMTAVHESLSMDRFCTPWCQWMLPFRMPRRITSPRFRAPP